MILTEADIKYTNELLEAARLLESTNFLSESLFEATNAPLKTKEYLAQTEKYLKRLSVDPEGVADDPNFQKMLTNFDKNSDVIRKARAKLVNKTDRELQVTDKRILDRIFKDGNWNIVEVIKQEYGKEIDKWSRTDGGNVFKSFMILLLILIVHQTLLAIFFLMTGGNSVVAMAILAICVAPITEEVARYTMEVDERDHSFSDSINIFETINYSLMALASGGLGGVVVTLIIRSLFSMNLHKDNSYAIMRDKLRNCIDESKLANRYVPAKKESKWTLYLNMLKHFFFNLNASIPGFGALIGVVIGGGAMVYSDAKSIDSSAKLESSFNFLS